MKNLSAILILFLLIFSACQSVQTPLQIMSPDGSVKITFDLTANGGAVYSVSYNDVDLIVESPLALDINPGGPWGHNLQVKSAQQKSLNGTYDLVVGKSAAAVNRCNEMIIELNETMGAKRRINLVFRAYDDGAAFRYVFPEQKALRDFEIIAEKSEFRFPTDYRCWALRLPSFTTSYEKEFEHVSISDLQPNKLIGLPLTIETGAGATLAITEANLTDYAGMYLTAGKTEHSLVTRLSPLPKSDICVKASATHVSPWRVVMIGATPGDLIESNIILNLNEPLAIDDPSWIKPGRVAWDWWSGQVVDDPAVQSGMNDATMKHYIDFAAEAGLEYMLIDAGWYGSHRDKQADITTMIPEINIPELVKYADGKNVGIMLWLNWASVDRQMEEAFSLYEKWGVKGVKIDYMNRDDQEMVNFYHRTVIKAAAHHLLVDFHGAYKPTGFRRTWPNLMTREGILGLEYLKWSDRATPEHNVTIPFTRMLAGPMDYTPGAFLNVTRAKFKSQRKNPLAPTTRCQQLAMYVVYESPLQMLSDAPAHYRHEPGLDFLQIVPTSWDETQVLAGKIGDYVAIARKSGDTWYIGVMTDSDGRTLDLPLDVLGAGEYAATIWSDGPGADHLPTRVTKSETRVNSQDMLKAVLAPGGGFVAVLEPAK